MKNKKNRCPHCKKEITQEDFLKFENNAKGAHSIKKDEIESKNLFEYEKKKIEREVQIGLQNYYEIKILERDQKIKKVEKKLAEVQMAVTEGNDTSKGDYCEEGILETLKNYFPHDEISKTPKGVHGGDINQRIHHFKTLDKQKVQSIDCGTILYEIKNTKTFQVKWIEKLRIDQQNSKANLGIILTSAMPKKEEFISLQNNIYILQIPYALPFLKFIRKHLIDFTLRTNLIQDKDKKMSLLYEYLMGHQFQEKLRNVVYTFKTLQGDLEKEKRTYQRLWAQREKRIELVLNSTQTLMGDLMAISDSSLPH